MSYLLAFAGLALVVIGLIADEGKRFVGDSL